jgi:hypothetical protein
VLNDLQALFQQIGIAVIELNVILEPVPASSPNAIHRRGEPQHNLAAPRTGSARQIMKQVISWSFRQFEDSTSPFR